VLQASYDKFVGLKGIAEDQADLLSGDRATAAVFDETCEITDSPELAAKWMINELPRALAGKDLADAGLKAPAFAELIELLRDDKLTPAGGKRCSPT